MAISSTFHSPLGDGYIMISVAKLTPKSKTRRVVFTICDSPNHTQDFVMEDVTIGEIKKFKQEVRGMYC